MNEKTKLKKELQKEISKQEDLAMETTDPLKREIYIKSAKIAAKKFRNLCPSLKNLD